MKCRLIISLLTLLSIMATGCAHLVTTQTHCADNPSGISYYLPKRDVKLTVTRKLSDEAKKRIEAAVAAKIEAEAGLSVAKAEKGEAQKSLETAMEAKTKVEADLSAAEAGSEEAKELSEKIKIADSNIKAARQKLTSAEKKVQAAKENLKKANVLNRKTLAESKKAKNFEDTIEIVLLPVVPDTTKVYVAKLKHSMFRDDDFKVSTTESGLLKSVDVVSTDKTGEIIIEVAKTIMEIVKAATGVPEISPLAAAVRPEEAEVFEFTYERIFDPLDSDRREDINDELKDILKTQYKLYVFPEDRSKTADVLLPNGPDFEQSSEEEKEIARKMSKGLLYRRSEPYTIKIAKELVDNEGNLVKRDSLRSEQVLLPNGAPIAVLPFKAGPFVTTTYDVEFDNGMLTKRNVNQPSEVMGFVKIPLAIAEKIVALPSQLIQLKIDYSSREKQLLENQKSVLEAEEALRKAVEELKKSQQDGGTGENR